MDRTDESNPPLLPVSGSKTGKSLFTHFHALCAATVSMAVDDRGTHRAGSGTLSDTSRSLKNCAG